MENEKTPQQILLDAASSLEKGEIEWGQFVCYQFERDRGVCRTCAHGAIDYSGKEGNKKLASLGSAPDVSYFYLGDSAQKTKQMYGNVGLAHLFANKVGLSFDYNDAKERTKGEVIAKLREAATLAEKESLSP